MRTNTTLNKQLYMQIGFTATVLRRWQEAFMVLLSMCAARKSI